MATKQVEITNIGIVHLSKRKGSGSIRISISSQGRVRVTMPMWVPFQAGIEFAKSKSDWISQQLSKPSQLVNGQTIGKAHHISFYVVNRTKIMTRVHNNKVLIALPGDVSADTPEAQEAARKAAIRALRIEAEQLLPRRLMDLANKYGFTYGSVTIKQMHGRWGSCSQSKDIVLNCYLMQLPWNLIDYVILHELTHTRIMAHGAMFWGELAQYVHNLSEVRHRMRSEKPIL